MATEQTPLREPFSRTAIASACLTLLSPLAAYFAMWAIIGVGHGPAPSAHMIFYLTLALCLLAGVLGVLGLRSKRRGRWLGAPGIALAIMILCAIAWILSDQGERGQYFPWLR